MARNLMLAGVSIATFIVAVVGLLQFIPGPHSQGDYLIIGCLATLAALLVLFVIVITTWAKAPDPFFKRKKPQ